MRIPPSRFATVATFLGLSLCVSATHSNQEYAPFDASTVLPSSPPEFVETLADNSMSPKCKVPSPPAHKSMPAPPAHHSMPSPSKPYIPPPTMHPPKPPTVHVPTPNTTQNLNLARSTANQIAYRQTANIQGHVTDVVVYQATQKQRQVAEAHARAYMNLLKRDAAEDITSTEPGRSTMRLTSRTNHPTTTSSKSKRHKRHRRHKLRHRYIAVDTVKDKRASRGTKKVVMIWDTQSETFVGNNVYDVKSTPSLGSTLVFDTYSSEYAGSGTVLPEDIAATPR